MTTIVKVVGREILDSRGNPTVEADVHLADGSMGRAAVPSGASTGEHEAVELRDGDKSRYLGKGALKAAGHINGEIAKAVVGKDATAQAAIDRAMIDLDGTPNKGRLGANAILAVSMATARAAAAAEKTPLYRYLGGAGANTLPVPMMNIINGGAHADNSVDVQEFMIAPFGALKFSEALRMGVEVFHTLKKVLSKKGYSTAVGDEGGFAPMLKSNEEAIESVLEAITQAGYQPGDADRRLPRPGGQRILPERQVRLQEVRQEPADLGADGGVLGRLGAQVSGDRLDRRRHVRGRLAGLEADDRKAGRARSSWWATTSSLPTRRSSNAESSRVSRIRSSIKVNQIGSLTETLEAMQMASRANYTAVVSHRSGETEDAFIADLVVATGAGQIKTGSASRTDRICKYNQLLRIEEELGAAAQFLGRKAFRQ